MPVQDLRNLTTTALEIARDRAALLGKVKDALIAGDDSTAVQLMKQYCGIEATNAQVHRAN